MGLNIPDDYAAVRVCGTQGVRRLKHRVCFADTGGRAKENAQTMFQVRSGRYLKSIRKSVRSSQNSVVARVYSNDPKAHLLERGVKPHEIRAVNATELAFFSFLGLTFRRVVKHPGMEGHAVFSTAFFDTLSEIETGLTTAVKDAARANEAAAAGAKA